VLLRVRMCTHLAVEEAEYQRHEDSLTRHINTLEN